MRARTLLLSFCILSVANHAFALDGPIRRWVTGRTVALPALMVEMKKTGMDEDAEILQLMSIESGLLNEGFNPDVVYQLDLKADQIYRTESNLFGRLARYLPLEPHLVWPNTEYNLLERIASIDKTVDQLLRSVDEKSDSLDHLSEAQLLQIGAALGVKKDLEETLSQLVQFARRKDLDMKTQKLQFLLGQPEHSLLHMTGQEAEALANLRAAHEEMTRLFLATFEAGIGAGAKAAVDSEKLETVNLSPAQASKLLNFDRATAFSLLSPKLKTEVIAMVDRIHAEMRASFTTGAISTYQRGRANSDQVCKLIFKGN